MTGVARHKCAYLGSLLGGAGSPGVGRSGRSFLSRLGRLWSLRKEDVSKSPDDVFLISKEQMQWNTVKHSLDILKLLSLVESPMRRSCFQLKRLGCRASNAWRAIAAQGLANVLIECRVSLPS